MKIFVVYETADERLPAENLANVLGIIGHDLIAARVEAVV